MKKHVFFCFIILFSSLLFGQQSKQLNSLDSLDKEYTKNNEKREIAYSFKNIGSIFNENNNIKQSLTYYYQSLNTYEEINDKEGIAKSLFNIGKIYNTQGDRKTALSYRDKSSKIQKLIDKQIENANSLNKLAFNYNNQSNTKLALDNYHKSLKIYFQLNDKTGIVNSLNNIGTIYINLGDKNRGLTYYDLSLKIKKDSKKRASEIKTEMNNEDGIAYSLNNIASVYLKRKDYLQAETFSDSALIFAKEKNYIKSICKAESLLTIIDSAIAFSALTQKIKKETALLNYKAHYKQYIIYRDSINNQQARTIDTTINKMPQAALKQNVSNRNKSISFISVLFILLLVVIYLLIKRKNK
jgi:tetratricopeptide (TPR) repeat protein